MRPSASVSNRAVKRRSARIQLKIRLTIEIGDQSTIEAETISVSKHGAHIRVTNSRGKLAHGERMLIAVRRGRGTKAARVVWLDKRAAAHYGIEIEDPGNFWGVAFPCKDGVADSVALPSKQIEHEERPRRIESRHPATALPAAPVASTTLAPVQPSRPEKRPGPKMEIGQMQAVVAGLSAARLPFAERVEVFFSDPEEGTALLQNGVEPGATLRLKFGNRTTSGRVVAVGGEREAGKWRVHIRCDATSA